MPETKAHIKNRMLKAASAAWGYEEKVNEAAFDPLVSLLMEVYAAELEKVSHEISMSRDRVLQRLVQLMVPDVLTAPIPAHSIAFAQSIGDRVLIDEQEQFYISRQHTSSGKTDSWFSPSRKVYLTDASIRYLATTRKIFRYSTPVSRELWSVPKSMLEPGVLWLGIAGHPSAINDAQFYFNMQNEAGRSAFYYHLPAACWYYKDLLLAMRPGWNGPETEEDGLADWLQSPHTASKTIIRMIDSLYSRCFVSVSEDHAEPIHFPEGIADSKENILPAALAGQVDEPLKTQWKNENIVWLRVQFPENIQPELLEDLHVQMNCFPVINRQLHEITYRLQHWINIIPLVSGQGQQFLDLQSVVDQEGNAFPSSRSGKAAPSILLRKGGAGKFDERDARSLIEQLLQLLRDESAAFSLYGRDFISNEIKQVQQTINRLSEQLAGKNSTNDPVPYLEVTGMDPGDSLHLQLRYWSTEGAAANGLKAGTPLMAYRNGGIRQGNIILMTMANGGRNRLLPHESIPAYKSAILSKDRIMSAEDIRLYCMRETGNLARAAQVKQGVMIGQGRNAGYVRTIDVFIELNKKDYAEMEASNTLTHWRDRLEAGLAERSMAFMPFRVFLTAHLTAN